MKPKILWVNLAGRIALIATVLSAVGILGAGMLDESDYLGFVLPIPDFQTILLGTLTAFLGYCSWKQSQSGAYGKRRGLGLICGAAVCVIFTFTPAAGYVQLFPSLIFSGVQENKQTMVEVSAENLDIHAFLGSDSSRPTDHDIMEFLLGEYDGHAEEEYKKYKVCGYLMNSPYQYKDFQIDFVLTDENGEDILIDGEPVVLTAEKWEQQSAMFASNTIRADKLPVRPVNCRIRQVRIAVAQKDEAQFRETNGLQPEADDSGAEDYVVCAFLGSGDSHFYDHDLSEFLEAGYDGRAGEEYSQYKICGYLIPDPQAEEEKTIEFPEFYTIDFALTDADGSDILIGDEPAVITVSNMYPGGMEFESDTIRAEELSAQPVNVRVLHVELESD